MHFAIPLVLLVLISSGHCDGQVEVVIKNGAVVGQQIIEQGVELAQFLGIPYAQPPVGKLRFRRPRPIEPWQHSVQALEWPNNCVQNLPPERLVLFQSKNFSEDCLYLNIWSPDVQVNEEHLRPVLVYIHGGGLVIGSSSLMLFDARTLAAMADAVVVTFNYRFV